MFLRTLTAWPEQCRLPKTKKNVLVTKRPSLGQSLIVREEVFSLLKSYHRVPWRDSISRPIALQAETIPPSGHLRAFCFKSHCRPGYGNKAVKASILVRVFCIQKYFLLHTFHSLLQRQCCSCVVIVAVAHQIHTYLYLDNICSWTNKFSCTYMYDSW
jgi:hypothetical protein